MGDHGLQESPGVFNEVTFRALDWLLDEARRNGIRIILSFADNWKYPGAAPVPHHLTLHQLKCVPRSPHPVPINAHAERFCMVRTLVWRVAVEQS